MEKKDISRIILKAVLLSGFSAIIIIIFRFYSMLRPAALGALYKEMIAGGIVLSLCFLNYFILYPFLYVKRRYLAYVLVTVLSAIVATFLEMMLVYPEISVFIGTVINASPREYLTAMTISLFLRDVCFVFFFFLIKLLESAYEENNDVNILLQNTNELLLARMDNKDKELITVRLKDIAYCQQDENYAYIYLTDGTKAYLNCSLKSLYAQLTPSRVVRVSRKALVFYRHIISYDDKCVYVDVSNNGTPVGLAITEAFGQQALPLLKEHCASVRNLQAKIGPEVTTLDVIQMSDNSLQTEKDAGQTDDLSIVVKKQATKQVLAFINARPGCKNPDITEHFHLSQSTVNRILRQLKEEGLITYEGAKKTGGYRVVNG